jgi:hypothetical protein
MAFQAPPGHIAQAAAMIAASFSGLSLSISPPDADLKVSRSGGRAGGCGGSSPAPRSCSRPACPLQRCALNDDRRMHPSSLTERPPRAPAPSCSSVSRDRSPQRLRPLGCQAVPSRLTQLTPPLPCSCLKVYKCSALPLCCGGEPMQPCTGRPSASRHASFGGAPKPPACLL